ESGRLRGLCVGSPGAPGAGRWALFRLLPLGFVFLFAALALPAAGQDPDDPEFGEKLLERGWTDAAERVFRALALEGPTPEARGRGELGLIRVLRRRAEAEPDPARKEALFGEALQGLRRWLRGRRDPQACLSLAELLRAQGDDLAARARSAADGAERAAAEASALAAYEEAAAVLDDPLREAKAALVAADGDLAELPGAVREFLRDGGFARADLPFAAAAVAGADPANRAGLLARADRLFEEYVWIFEDETALAWVAVVRRGQIASAREEFGAALELFDQVLAVEEPEGAGPEQKALRARLRILAWHRSLEALVLAGRKDPARFEEALARAARMEAEVPRHLEDGFPDPLSGRFAALEKAKALAGLGRYDEAAGQALRIAALGGPAAAAARDFVCALAPDAAGAGALPLVWRAEALLREGKAALSIEAFQAALSRIGARGGRDLAVRAWRGIAAAYELRGQAHEAGLAYREAEDEALALAPAGAPSEAREEAAALSFQALQCFRKAWEGTGRSSSSLASLCEDQQGRILRRYGEIPAAGDLHLLAAAAMVRAGEFRKAVDELARMSPASRLRREGLVLEGQAWVGEAVRLRKGGPADGGPGAGECLIKAAEALAKALAPSPAAPGAAAEGAPDLPARARFVLARVRAEQGSWGEAAACLDGFEGLAAVRPGLAAKAALLRVQAVARLRRAEGVESALASLDRAADAAAADEAADARRARAEGRRLAGAFFAEEADAAADPAQALERNRRAAALLVSWAKWLREEGAGRPPEEVARGLAAAGSRAAKAGAWEGAAECYEALARMEGPALPPAEALRARKALAECLAALGRWERAVEVLREVRAADASEAAGDALANALFRLGEEREAAGDARSAARLFDEALGALDALLRDPDPGKRACWERKERVWRILLKRGAFREVVLQVTNAELLYPWLGGPELKSRILALREEAKRRDTGRPVPADRNAG
ncbi:MAG: hypothetical protein MUC63_08925, partial [Planctomycetes bacterium]|nr:hypothetical protein [Planctomycetota bacterium]